ncbi:hypothetical protein TNCV_698011 [Trichonephila clavipes]|nr:hypothetical protein TNCV_698011 [Trichonephila clavipes]
MDLVPKMPESLDKQGQLSIEDAKETCLMISIRHNPNIELYWQCKVGARVVGCCGHVASVLWYLGYWHHNRTQTKTPSLVLDMLIYFKTLQMDGPMVIQPGNDRRKYNRRSLWELGPGNVEAKRNKSTASNPPPRICIMKVGSHRNRKLCWRTIIHGPHVLVRSGWSYMQYLKEKWENFVRAGFLQPYHDAPNPPIVWSHL